MALKKRTVYVTETDPNHGAVDWQVHCRDCPEDLQYALNGEEQRMVPWYRVKAFQQVSIRQLLGHILVEEVNARGGEERLYLDKDFLHKPLELPRLARSSNHIYVSTDNEGASEVASLLASELLRRRCSRHLTIAATPQDAKTAPCFLLYLNKHTYTYASGGPRTALHDDVADAMARGATLILVHEQRSQHSAVPFAYFLEHQSTPESLLEAGIYNNCAIPLYDGEHGRVSLALMAMAINGANATPNAAQTSAGSHQSHTQRFIARILRHNKSLPVSRICSTDLEVQLVRHSARAPHQSQRVVASDETDV